MLELLNFNTYGINMDSTDGKVISNFINQCLKTKTLQFMVMVVKHVVFVI